MVAEGVAAEGVLLRRACEGEGACCVHAPLWRSWREMGLGVELAPGGEGKKKKEEERQK